MPINLWTRCDGPGCDRFQLTAPSQPPPGWLNINNQVMLCSFTCMALYAAQMAGQLEKPEPMPNGKEPDANLQEATVDATGTAS